MQGFIHLYRDQNMNLDDLLKSGNSDFSFRPDDGALRSALVAMLLATENEEFADLFSESSSDISVGVYGTSVAEGLIRCRVYGDFGERSLECRLATLTQTAFADLTEQLSHLDAVQTASSAPHHGARGVLRRKAEINLFNMLSCEEAAQQLNLPRQTLKSMIPCSDYSYSEVNDKIVIQEYYWSKNLIQRLCDIKTGGATAEDCRYIADECCHGDLDWAKEIIGLFSRQTLSGQRNNAAQPDIAKSPATSSPAKHAHYRHHRKKPV